MNKDRSISISKRGNGNNVHYQIQLGVISFPRSDFVLQSSRNRVDLLLYKSKPTDKREQYDCNYLDGVGRHVQSWLNSHGIAGQDLFQTVEWF